MKELNDRELKIIEWLESHSGKGAIPMRSLLQSCFFTKQENKFLIVQPRDQFAVYFLDVTYIQDAKAKNDAVTQLMELVLLLRYLNSQGYISVIRGEHYTRENIFYYSENFVDPHIEDNKIILNNEGLYSDHPESIKNADHQIAYRGIRLDKGNFELIYDVCIGDLCISDSIQKLLRQKNEKSEPQQRPSEKTHTSRKAPFGLVGVFLSILILLGLVFSLLDGRSQFKSITNKLTKIHVAHLAQERSPESNGKIHGIDISHWNGNPLEKINQHPHIKFVITKATEGIHEVDEKFEHNWKKIKSLGLIRGAYHFYRLDRDPTAQAQHFWQTIKNIEKEDLSPVVDIEPESWGNNKAIDTITLQIDLLAFLVELEKLSGRRPMIYTGYNFAAKYITHEKFSQYPLWIADYTKNPEPKIPGVWKEKGYTIWQKSNSYNFDSTMIDFDVMRVE